MKTLFLLSALALLAFLAQADPLPEAIEQAVNEEQAGVENQDLSISFGDSEGSALQDAVRGRTRCTCRKVCRPIEHIRGSCLRPPYLLCCS